MAIARLLAEGVIEKVSPDASAAHDEFQMARTHLDTVPSIVPRDPVLAYTCLYDPVRKAISAHMRMSGFRTTPGRHHSKFIAYAEAVSAGKGLDVELGELDRLRNQRNDTEYRARFLSQSQVEADLEIARALIGGLGRDLGL